MSQSAAILDRRTLNRALLQRQLLLERQQEPQAPYLGLCSRLDFAQTAAASACVIEFAHPTGRAERVPE